HRVPAERLGPHHLVEPGSRVSQAGVGRLARGTGPLARIRLVPDRDVLASQRRPLRLPGGAGRSRALLRIQRRRRLARRPEAARLERRTGTPVASTRRLTRRVIRHECCVAGVAFPSGATMSPRCSERALCRLIYRGWTFHGGGGERVSLAPGPVRARFA